MRIAHTLFSKTSIETFIVSPFHNRLAHFFWNCPILPRVPFYPALPYAIADWVGTQNSALAWISGKVPANCMPNVSQRSALSWVFPVFRILFGQTMFTHNSQLAAGWSDIIIMPNHLSRRGSIHCSMLPVYKICAEHARTHACTAASGPWGRIFRPM